MEQMDKLQPGLFREEQFIVGEQHTAYHIGSGDERVLGTPWMISFMERVANRLVLDHLPDGYMSVGIHVDVKHLAATPVHSHVRVQVKIRTINKNKVLLGVEAWDAYEKIGEGIHTRAIVDKARFIERVMKKEIV